MRYVDLFAGPGGWDEGLRRLDEHDDCLGIEWCPGPCETASRAGHLRMQADVAALNPKDFVRPEGLIGSPPCPSYSRAGRQAGKVDSQFVEHCAIQLGRGNDFRAEHKALCTDERSILTVEPLRWALDLMPRWIALEQVPGVLPLWELFARILETRGYHTATANLSAEQFGVPQTRRRAYLIASLDGPVSLPAPTHEKYRKGRPRGQDPSLLPWVSMAEALGWSEQEYVGFPRRADEGRPSIEINGTAYRERDLRPSTDPAFALTEKARSWKRYYRSDAQAHAAVRPISTPAPTLKFAHAHLDAGWVPDEEARVRTDGEPITEQEASVLMGFRADYPWSDNSRTRRFLQISDAVCPPVAERVLAAAMRLDSPDTL
jgi:DNA (cytosine-5)-methyltransferase 1